MSKHRWGVILAGGEGMRLRAVTRLIAGDDRPKQFCKLMGERSLLAETRLRVARTLPSEQTLLVLTKSHERFYTTELADVPPIRMVAQPANRGTLPAILWSLMRLARLDESAVVGFFPCDHHYQDEQRFTEEIEHAFEAAAESRSVILLGAEAAEPETEYGWIEPEFSASHRKLLKVRRFWEKPARQLAVRLLDQGCLWNTFVMVGQANAFLELIRSAEPDLYEAFETVVARCRMDLSAELMSAIYEELQPADFSKQVLVRNADKLHVFSVGDIGWSDLGDPGRVLAALSEVKSRKPVPHAALPEFVQLAAGA
jgi:mannose-1-phosphate guanylyltransferase